MRVDVQALDCDFYAFSGHKMLRPDRHRRALREGRRCSTRMPPYQGGGDMIQLGHVRADALQRRCRTSSRPARRTSPAPIGLAAALDYRESIGLDRIAALRARAARLRRRTPWRACRVSAIDRHGRVTKPVCWRSCSTASIRTTSARFSTARASRFAPATIAASRSWIGSACPRNRARVARALQHARGDRRADRTRSTKCARCSYERR